MIEINLLFVIEKKFLISSEYVTLMIKYEFLCSTTSHHESLYNIALLFFQRNVQ